MRRFEDVFDRCLLSLVHFVRHLPSSYVLGYIDHYTQLWSISRHCHHQQHLALDILLVSRRFTWHAWSGNMARTPKAWPVTVEQIQSSGHLVSSGEGYVEQGEYLLCKKSYFEFGRRVTKAFAISAMTQWPFHCLERLG